MMTIFRYSIVKCDIVKYMPKLIFLFQFQFQCSCDLSFNVAWIVVGDTLPRTWKYDTTLPPGNDTTDVCC